MTRAPAIGLDARAFRTLFPALTRDTYLASCSLGARHAGLDAALAQMLDEVHRPGGGWSAYEARIDSVRRRAAAFLGTVPEKLALVPNATIGAYQAASTLSYARRPRIVSTEEEFPSISHVWLAQRARGADVVHVPAHPCGEPEAALAHWRAAIDERTALVSIPLVAFRTGARLPVREVLALAHAAGARVFVDAYQGAGVMPIDFGALGCDYLVTGTHKYLLGVSGLAFLAVRDPQGGEHEPTLTGWMGRPSPFDFDPATLGFPAEARRFETGTQAVAPIYAADAALGLLERCPAPAIHAYVARLVRTAHARLREAGETLATRADEAGPMLALLDRDPPALARRLAAQRVAVSPRAGALRMAFHYYNDEDDIDALCEALRRQRREAHCAPAH